MAPAQSSTIAAIATPTGVGAISLIRISGPRAIEIADQACGGIASATMPYWEEFSKNGIERVLVMTPPDEG